MSISPGDKARRKLAKGLKRIANNITIVAQPPGTPCPGAFDEYSQEYDPKIDRSWHQAHPSAAVCVKGRVGASPVTRVVKAFHFPSLRDADLKFLGLGEININQAVFLTPYDQDLTDMEKYRNPTHSEEWFRLDAGYPRSIALNDVDIFWIAKATKI